jgi:[ribosomal protein S18]-alanine N-acetyltransferase
LYVRRATAADVPAMMDLERRSPTAAHWSLQQYEDLFVPAKGEKQSERLAWIVEDEHGVREILAFLIAHRIVREWELENIAVAGAVRGRGVGTRLLGEFIAHARAEKASGIFLEVRESNESARALYRKMGFEETGSRKSYYSDPAEDAILCRLSFVRTFS